MLDEELHDELLSVKLNYLNGYLQALAFVNSYSIIGMNYKLFAFNFSAGDIQESIHHNAYELFGVYPNSYDFEINEVKNWKQLLLDELTATFTRRIPGGDVDEKEYVVTELVKEMYSKQRGAFKYFISLLENGVLNSDTTVYELKVKTKNFYRIVGIDLIFEIGNTKLVFLQIKGAD